ncbi:REJ domain [Popillia japonica]
MLGVNKLAVLLAIFAAYPPLIETSNPRYQWEKCIPEINFLSCLDNSADEPKIQYNSLTYELEIEVIRGCASSDLYNYWSLFDKASGELINPYTDRKNKNTLIIYKSQLELGDYILVAHVRETAVFTGDIWVEKKCYIRIVTACPVPTISGGYYKTVPRGFEVIFSSIRSFTCLMDVTYVWSCSSSEDSENCRNINGKRGKEIKMVADTNVGSTYTVTVTTSVPKVPEKTFTQTIYVTEAAYPVVFIT